MGVYKKAVITDAGNALRAQAVAGNVTMQFTHAKASSYLYPEGTDLKKLTELQEVRQTIVPSKVQISNDTLISVRALFGNEKITSSYLIQNVGVYVSDGNKEILFAVCQAVTPDQMPAYDGVAPSSFIYDIQLAVAQATEINITIGEAGTATVKDVMDLEKRMDSLIQTMKKNSLSVTVEGDTLCFSGGWKEEQELTSVAFTNLSFGALPASADTDNWAVTEGDLKVSAELSDQTEKFVAQIEKSEG